MDDGDGGVVVDAVAFDVSVGWRVPVELSWVSDEATGAILTMEQITVADRAALAGYKK